MTGFAAYGIMALFSDVISSFLFSKASFIVEVFEAIVHNGMVALPLRLLLFTQWSNIPLKCVIFSLHEREPS